MVKKKFNKGKTKVLLSVFKPLNDDHNMLAFSKENDLTLITIDDFNAHFSSINELKSLYYEDINYSFTDSLYKEKNRLVMDLYRDIKETIKIYEIDIFIWTINPNLLHLDFCKEIRKEVTFAYWNISGKDGIDDFFLKDRFDYFFDITKNEKFSEDMPHFYSKGLIYPSILEKYNNSKKDIDILFIANYNKKNKDILNYFTQKYECDVIGKEWGKILFSVKNYSGRKTPSKVKDIKSVDIYKSISNSKIVIVLDQGLLAYSYVINAFALGSIAYSDVCNDAFFDDFNLNVKDKLKNNIAKIENSRYFSDNSTILDEYSMNKTFSQIIATLKDDIGRKNE